MNEVIIIIEALYAAKIICDWLWKTDPNRTFDISRITDLKYLTHCESLLLGCSHAKLTV